MIDPPSTGLMAESDALATLRAENDRLIALLQVVPCLRILRTMPRRLSTITHCLVLWPLALTVFLGIIAHVLQSLVDRVPIDWNGCVNSLVGGSLLRDARTHERRVGRLAHDDLGLGTLLTQHPGDTGNRRRG